KITHYKPKVFARQPDNYGYGNGLGYAEESRYGPRGLFSADPAQRLPAVSRRRCTSRNKPPVLSRATTLDSSLRTFISRMNPAVVQQPSCSAKMKRAALRLSRPASLMEQVVEPNGQPLNVTIGDGDHVARDDGTASWDGITFIA